MLFNGWRLVITNKRKIPEKKNKLPKQILGWHQWALMQTAGDELTNRNKWTKATTLKLTIKIKHSQPIRCNGSWLFLLVFEWLLNCSTGLFLLRFAHFIQWIESKFTNIFDLIVFSFLCKSIQYAMRIFCLLRKIYIVNQLMSRRFVAFLCASNLSPLFFFRFRNWYQMLATQSASVAVTTI